MTEMKQAMFSENCLNQFADTFLIEVNRYLEDSVDLTNENPLP